MNNRIDCTDNVIALFLVCLDLLLCPAISKAQLTAHVLCLNPRPNVARKKSLGFG